MDFQDEKRPNQDFRTIQDESDPWHEYTSGGFQRIHRPVGGCQFCWELWVHPENLIKQDPPTRKKRHYRRHRRDRRYYQLKNKTKLAKKYFYKKNIEDLKSSKPGEWYKKLKRMCNYDQSRSQQLIVEEIAMLSSCRTSREDC